MVFGSCFVRFCCVRCSYVLLIGHIGEPPPLLVCRSLLPSVNDPVLLAPPLSCLLPLAPARPLSLRLSLEFPSVLPVLARPRPTPYTGHDCDLCYSPPRIHSFVISLHCRTALILYFRSISPIISCGYWSAVARPVLRATHKPQPSRLRLENQLYFSHLELRDTYHTPSAMAFPR